MTDKELAIKSIEKLPDDATFNEIRYEIDVLAMLQERREEVNAGKNMIPHDEVKQRLHKWLE